MSYITLNGARDFDFTASSDLTTNISYLFKVAANSNLYEREQSDIKNACNINKGRLFVPKTEDPLETVIDILDDENVEHKKMTHPYVQSQVQTADEIETETRQVDDEFAKLKADYNQINDAATEQKKQEKITDLVDDIIAEDNPFQNLGTEDIWIDDDIFDNHNNQDIVNVSKDILKGIKENDPYLDFNISTETIIDNLFELSDDVTIEDSEDWDSFEPSDNEGPEFIVAEPAIPQLDIIIPDTNTISIDNGPEQSKKHITTRMNSSIRASNKIKEKYR